MKIRLKIAASIWKQLRDYHLAPGKQVEALSYVFARVVVTPEAVTILVPHTAKIILFSPDCFVRQAGGNVQLHPDVLNGLLVQFAQSGDANALINIHDHWFDLVTQFSGVDDRDDMTFDQYLRERFEPMLVSHPNVGPARAIYNVSVVLAQHGVDARLTDIRRRSVFRSLDSIDVLGDGFERIDISKNRREQASDIHIRQKDFIRPAHQLCLAGMEVILVGAGGLGSILGEDLGRIGTGGVTVVDDDVLDLSNLNRWQGARPEDIGQPKAELLARRLREMFPAMRVRAVNRSIFDASVERVFAEGDVVVGALDNDPARYFLNTVALQYQMAYFDAGVAVEAGETTDFLSRYFAVLPGTSACVECGQFQFVNWEHIADAFMDETTRNMKRASGYIVDHPEVSAPSVYMLNQRAASVLVSELLNFVCRWRPTATSILESWRKGSVQRADRENFAEPPALDCPVCGFRAGVGDSEKLPRPFAHRGAASAPFFPQHPFKEM